MWLSLILSVTVSVLNYCSSVNGYCMTGPLQNEITEVTKRIRQFCEYKSPSGGPTVRLFPGSKIYTLDCVECSCSLGGLSCCGFGSHAGTVGLPDDCTKLQDGCQELHVKKNNTTLDCFTGKPIDLIKMAFKPHPDNFVGINRASKEAKTVKIEAGGKADVLPNFDISKFLQTPNARSWRHLVPGLEPTKLQRPLPVNELLQQLMMKHVPAGSSVRTITNMETLPMTLTGKSSQTSSGVPRLELTKLDHSRPVSEILQELMAKHLPAQNGVRSVSVQSGPRISGSSQTTVDTSSRMLPQMWHAPMAAHPYPDTSYSASWLPWLFVDHI